MTASKRVTSASTARSKLNSWENEIYTEVLHRYRAASAIPHARFNFLVVEKRVFFIDVSSWWHSVPGSARKIAKALRADGIEIIRVKLVSTSAGWTPYFGRTRDEERNRGWNEPKIELTAARGEFEHLLRHALDIHRAHMAAKRCRSNVT